MLDIFAEMTVAFYAEMRDESDTLLRFFAEVMV
jgi:hypothetical protein